jgi:hypothetical protein
VKVGEVQRLCILGEGSFRNELLQAAEDMVVEPAFELNHIQHQERDPVAAGDVCRCLDGRTGLPQAEEHMALPACPQEQHQRDHRFALHMLTLQVRQSAPSVVLPT